MRSTCAAARSPARIASSASPPTSAPGRTLRPGRDCIVALEFAPRAGGDRAASLHIPNAYRDLDVALSGVGAVVPGHKDVFVTLGGLRITTASRRQLVDDMALLFEQDFLMTGDVSWRLRYRGTLLGEIRRRHISGPGTQQVRLAITPAGLRALRRGNRHLVLTTALTDADGRRSVVRRMVRFAGGG